MTSTKLPPGAWKAITAAQRLGGEAPLRLLTCLTCGRQVVLSFFQVGSRAELDAWCGGAEVEDGKPPRCTSPLILGAEDV